MAGVALLLAVGVGAMLLLGGGKKDHTEPTTTASSASDADIGTVEERTSPGAVPVVSALANRQAVIEVLREYEVTYSEASLTGMADLFTSDVERHGLSADGCSTVSGKSSVLAAYRSQFTQNGPVPYELVGLTPGAVSLYGDEEARVETEYSIASGSSSGAIDFTLENRGGSWRISAVNATCNPSSS